MSSSSTDGSPVADTFWGELLTLIPTLSTTARRITRDEALAADLVQETCRRAVEARGRFMARSNMRAWLMCILRNLAFDHFRHARLEVVAHHGSLEVVAPEAEEPALWRRISPKQLADAVVRLPQRLREVHVLYWNAGLSYEQISAQLGLLPSTVGSRLKRARDRLRVLLLAAMSDVIAIDPRRARAERPAKAPAAFPGSFGAEDVEFDIAGASR